MTPYWILAAYAAGIGLSASIGPIAGWWPGLVAGGLGLLWLALRHSPLAPLPLAGALVLAGFLWAHQALEPPRHPDHIAHFDSAETVAIEGVVQQTERLWNGRSRLDVAVDRLGVSPVPRPATGLVRLTVGEGGPAAVPGDRICWQGRLRRPVLFGTPGEFDYPRHLAARDIYVTSFVGRGTDLARMAMPEPQGQLCERLRGTIAERIALAVPGANAGLVQTLVVGIGGGITPEQRNMIAAGGLAHLFSISGLHFSMMAMLAYVLGNRLYRRSERLLLLAPPRRILPLLLLPPLYGYLLLSGNAAPTRRSFGMIALAALLFSSHRRTPPLALLATVALGMLIISPLNLFEPSFQLSFAGVAGLMVWLPAWQTRLDGQPTWLRATGLASMTTVAASLATMPIVLWHFHQIAPAGLVTNLVAVPLVTWGAVPAGLAGALLIPFSPWLSNLGFVLAGKVVDLTVAFTEWCLALPGLQALTVHVSWNEGLGVLLLTAACLPIPSRRRFAILSAALLLMAIPATAPARLQVIALSVGQGDATLLSIAGQHYLIDGGSLAGTSADVGERLIGPALGRLGATHLAAVILTHDHPDHSSGLPYVLEHFLVDGFWSALPLERLEPNLAEVLIRQAIPVHTLPEGWSEFGRGPETAPVLFVPKQEAEDPNDRSIVVYARTGNDGVLLTGDLAAAGFTQLFAAGLPEPVTLLKLPHHGSRGSRPEQLLERLQPRLAFVSAGRDNPYRLPHPTSITACAARGIPLFRTDRQGTLTFSSAGDSWQTRCFLSGDD